MHGTTALTSATPASIAVQTTAQLENDNAIRSSIEAGLQQGAMPASLRALAAVAGPASRAATASAAPMMVRDVKVMLNLSVCLQQTHNFQDSDTRGRV